MWISTLMWGAEGRRQCSNTIISRLRGQCGGGCRDPDFGVVRDEKYIFSHSPLFYVWKPNLLCPRIKQTGAGSPAVYFWNSSWLSVVLKVRADVCLSVRDVLSSCNNKYRTIWRPSHIQFVQIRQKLEICVSSNAARWTRASGPCKCYLRPWLTFSLVVNEQSAEANYRNKCACVASALCVTFSSSGSCCLSS